MYAFMHLVLPVASEFNPDFVIISAGFDSADGDPKGQMKVTPGCYAHMTHHLLALAGGRMAVLLEGGYDPQVHVCFACHGESKITNNLTTTK